jgi:hypothetical protein
LGNALIEQLGRDLGDARRLQDATNRDDRQKQAGQQQSDGHDETGDGKPAAR